MNAGYGAPAAPAGQGGLSKPDPPGARDAGFPARRIAANDDIAGAGDARANRLLNTGVDIAGACDRQGGRVRHKGVRIDIPRSRDA